MSPFLLFTLVLATAHVPDATHQISPKATRCIAIVGTNDVHGAIEPKKTYADQGTGATEHGGVLAFSGYMRALRKLYPDRLALLDAGDIFQGTMPSNLSQGRAMIVAYNALGYDAAAIGNHEFDFGAEGPLSPHAQAEAQAIDRTGVLKSRIAEAKFPFLAVNIDDRLTHSPIRWKNVRPSLIKTIGGIRVGILGASTPTTPTGTRALNVAELIFADPGPRIAQEARKLREKGAQLVILVTHMGGACNLNDPLTLHSCEASTAKNHELLDVLTTLPKKTVDVVVAGHTHEFMAHWLDETAIIESGSQGQFLGLIEACVSSDDGDLDHATFDKAQSRIHQPISLCLTTWEDGTCSARSQATPVLPATLKGYSVAPDKDLVASMEPFLASVHKAMSRPLGAFLPEKMSAQTLGMITAEAMRRQMRSDFGLHNAGGVRTGLNAGVLTYGQVFEALPFDNYVTQVTLTGAQIEELAKLLADQPSRGRTTQYANLRIHGRGDGRTVTDGKGKPLRPDKLYTLSTTDFIVEGGDHTGVVMNGLHERHVKSSEMSARDATAAYISQTFKQHRVR